MDQQIDTQSEKRQFPRYPFKQAVQYQIGDFSCPDGSLSKDLSRGGICLTVNQFVPVNGPIVLYIKQTQDTKVVVLKGSVSWVKVLSEADFFQIGVQFEGLNESVKREMNSLFEGLD